MMASNGSPAAPDRAKRSRAALALLLLLPAPTLGVLVSLLWWPQAALAKPFFVATKLWILLLPLAWRLWVDREPLSWSPPRHGGFGVALGSGVFIALFMFATYAVVSRLGWIESQKVAAQAARTGLNQPAVYVAGALYWITANSLMEEYVWRWFTFRKFEVLVGGPAAVALSALGFTLHHVFALMAQVHWPMVVLGSLGVFTGGAIWSWLYLKYRSVWPCYVSHAIVDVPIFVIGWRLIFAS